MNDSNKRMRLSLAKEYEYHKQKNKEAFEMYLDALDKNSENSEELNKLRRDEEFLMDVSARALATLVLEMEEELTC